MANYYMLQGDFYWDPDFENRGHAVLHMYTYLGASKFCNQIGLYQRSFRNICDDAQMPKTVAQKALETLQEMEKIQWDGEHNLVWIRGYLKRLLVRWSDTTFKGLLPQVLSLNPKLEIVRLFAEQYRERLLEVKPSKKYREEDRERLVAFFQKLEGPSMGHTGGIHAPSMGPNRREENSIDLNSSLSSEEKDSNANPGPTSTQESILPVVAPVEEVILAYWKERVQSKYGDHLTAKAQTLTNIRTCLKSHDGRDLLGAVARYGTKMDADSERKGGGDPYPVVGSNFFGRAGHFAEYLPKPDQQVEHRAAAEAIIARLGGARG